MSDAPEVGLPVRTTLLQNGGAGLYRFLRLDYQSERHCSKTDNCDCHIVASWDKDGVEGYDPTAYHNEWLGRENFTIPEAKLTGYALNMNHAKGKDKAIAFREALGFTSDDAPEIMRQVYRWVGAHEPIYSHTDQFGDRLTTDMMMTGKNGKTAKVTVGWIKEPGADKMRMTSIYVSKRKR